MDLENHKPGYKVVPFPKLRRLVIDSVRLGSRKHLMHGLVEVDVTRARRCLREHKAKTGESLSFTAFILACLGRALDLNRDVLAHMDWRGRLVIFDDVDVTTMIEVEIDQEFFPLAHVIRAVNRRTAQDIHNEIRAIKAHPEGDFRSSSQQRWLLLFLSLPAFVRDFFYRIVLMNPHWMKRYIGTMIVTSVGMFGGGSFWGISPPLYNLGLTLGGISEKPGVVAGQIEIREYLHLTVSFDHDVIDGAPATRFARQFVELIENGYGLDDLDSAGPSNPQK